jgi:NADH-quinone oxidoreductase subunit F
MERINHPEQLSSCKSEILEGRLSSKKTIVISSGTCGQASGSLQIIDAVNQELEKNGLQDKADVKVTGCHGFCQLEPNLIVYPEQTFYKNLKPEDIPEIIQKSVVENQIASSFIFKDPQTKQEADKQNEIPFYKKQKRVLTENDLKIDPKKIEDYIALDGYQALANTLFNMTSEGVIAEVEKAGLRGRGGAGFPTGRKWEICRKAQSDVKYIICNADEGDPGAYMDRSLLEGNPHSVIEGMIIGAYAIGAQEGYIYVRMEYPLAVQHVRLALEQARKYGFLGESILGSEFAFSPSETSLSGARGIVGKANEQQQRGNLGKCSSHSAEWLRLVCQDRDEKKQGDEDFLFGREDQ